MATNQEKKQAKFSIPEDWLAVLIAFVLVLLSALGLLGPNGIQVPF